MSDFTTVASVGGLLPTDLLARVAANDTDLPGTSAEDYGLVPGERLNDHVTRSWNRLVGLWQNFQHQLQELPESERTATTLTRDRWTLPLLDELGFAGLPTAKTQQIGGKDYPISHEWDAQVPVHLPGARILIDRRTPGIPGAATTSPHGLVQEYLNRSDHHLWGLVSNGLVLRLLRDNASLTRQAYVEFDLAAMFDSEAFSDFVLLWLCCHRTRFAGDPPEKCLLEQWSHEAVTSGTRALDKLRDGVETAITELGEGFVAHPANGTLRDALRSGSLAKNEYQRQLLRIVYRLLFLLVAESRDLLLDPAADATAKERYRRYYSVDRLRRLARARRGTSHDDLWAGLTVVMQALHRDGAPSLALAPLGSFLWSPDAITNLAGASIDNRHLLDAVRALTLVRDDESRVHRTVDYRNLGAEELGSIYESLLELHADVDADARTFRLDTAAGNERKTTGSYYTPTALITELLDSALNPVLDAACQKSDPEAAILDLSMIDMAIGSGHFAIAAANRIAQRLAAIRAGGVEPAPDEVRSALRDVIGRCIHGIDVNPMAVELCKVSLWLEAMEPGKPLSFLDHRIVCGNALLGTTPRLLAEGIPDDAFKPLLGDDKTMVTSLKKRNKQERKGQLSLGLGESLSELAKPLTTAYAAIDAIGDSSLEKVAEKHQLFQRLLASAEAERARLAADAWCAAFVVPKVPGEPPITTDTVRQIREDPEQVASSVISRVRELAAEYQFVHPHLAFPDVLVVPDEPAGVTDDRNGWAGGFDVVLGNPPWERVKLQEKEFFAERDPDIATAPNAAARKKLIANLETVNPSLWTDFWRASRRAEGASHLLRNTGRFPLCGRGDVNTYTVFAELMRSSLAPAGRAGVIVPTGIATDDTTKHFFADLVSSESLVSLFDFINDSGMFPGVGHGRQKFCLLTMAGASARVQEAEFVFFAQTPVDLSDPERRFALSSNDFARLNPNTRTCPIFSTRRDAQLTRRIYERMGVVVNEEDPDGNPWSLSFQRMIDMANDSDIFRTEADLVSAGFTRTGNQFEHAGSKYVPLYEAKMLHHFDHRWGDYAMRPEGSQDSELPSVSNSLLADPTWLPTPRYWVPHEEVVSRNGEPWVAGWRKTARSRDVRTVIAAVGPEAGYNDKFQLFNGVPAPLVPTLMATLSSFAFDFAARQKLGGTDISYFIFKQLPIPAPSDFDTQCAWSPSESLDEWIAIRAIELIYTAWDLEPFAIEAGWSGPPFRWDPARRTLLRGELDAALLHVYGLDRSDAEYVFSTFPIVRRTDEREYGSYVTRDLTLDIFDSLAASADKGVPYASRLEPGPSDASQRHAEDTRPRWASARSEM